MNEWVDTTLGEISSQRKGINYKSEDYCLDDSGHPFITIKCFQKGGGYESTGIKFYDGFSTKSDHLTHGDILFSVTDLTRAGDIVGSPLRVPTFSNSAPALASMDCMRITPIEGKSSRSFLYHRLMLSDVRRQMVAYAAGSTVLHLDTKKVPTIKVRIPLDITIQEKIATILSTIDTAIEQTEALIEKYQHIKAGLMHDLFTRGVLPNGQLRPPREQAPELYQETAIGWIPKEWDVSDCATEFAIDSGITLGPHRRPNKRPHPYLRVANVHRDELRLEDIAQMEVETSEIEFSLKKYDLLVVEGHANRSEIGRCAMVRGDAEGMLFQNHLFRLRPNRMEPHYALFWMNSHYAQRYWEVTCSSSSGLNTINRRMLGRLTVFVPAIDEQQRIVDKALSVKQMLQAEQTKVQKLQTQKHGLMQDLLTGKVSVQ